MRSLLNMLIPCFIVLFNCNVNELKSQILSDSSKLAPIIEAVDAMYECQSVYYEKLINFEMYITQNYCILNKNDRDKGDEFLEFVLRPNFLKTYSKHKFLIDNFKCFSDTQKKLITSYISIDLVATDIFYHKLVSNYKINSQTKYLLIHSSDTIFNELKRDISDGKISEFNEVQLKNLTTLYNLEVVTNEDWFLEQINDIYDYLVSLNDGTVKSFFESILPNSIALLNSKKAVISTLYFMDLEKNSKVDESDLALISPAYSYFLGCVLPKLKSEEIFILAYTDFESNKNKIKNLILNDDSIWSDHIR